jgi:hypothetical protein
MEAEEALALVADKVDQELLLRNEYLAAENEIMRSKIPGRVLMTNSERKRLAELGHKLGREVLADVAAIAAIVKPETILTWYPTPHRGQVRRNRQPGQGRGPAARRFRGGGARGAPGAREPNVGL